MSDSSLEDRVLKAEWRIDEHDSVIRELKMDARAVASDLHEIQSTLLQIKYFAMGAIGLYFINSLGLTEALKLFAGG